MPDITLIVEDGTGLSTAMSFATVEYITTYWTLRGGNEIWTGATPTEKKAGAAIASDYVSLLPLFPYAGTRSANGRLAWPRSGAVRRNGHEIASNVVPWELPEAVAILAPRAIEKLRNGESMLPPQNRGNAVASESGLGFSRSYFKDAPTYEVHQDVQALLANLCRSSNNAEAIEVQGVTRPDDLSESPAMYARTFTNPGSGVLPSIDETSSE